MKDLFKLLPIISKQLSWAKDCLLMLDFDGTLSPIAKTPSRAFLPKKNKELLKKISHLIPVAIVSGRGLSNIKNKIGIKGLIYAGNHGLEWEVSGKRSKIKIPAKQAMAILAAGKLLKKLADRHSGLLLENKELTLSLHYRLLKKNLIKKVLDEARRTLAPFQNSRLLNISYGKKIIEIRPALLWHKGKMANFLRKKIGRDLLPIYIGDDTTDEDAFKVLKSGITIKVGKSKHSHAKYFCRDSKQITVFLNWLLNYL